MAHLSWSTAKPIKCEKLCSIGHQWSKVSSGLQQSLWSDFMDAKAELSLLGAHHLDRIKRSWYLSPMRAAKVQASLRIRAVSPEPPLPSHTSSESRGTFRQKTRSLAPLNGWACAVEICHDGMLQDTNSLDGANFIGYAVPRFIFNNLLHVLSCRFSWYLSCNYMHNDMQVCILLQIE